MTAPDARACGCSCRGPRRGQVALVVGAVGSWLVARRLARRLAPVRRGLRSPLAAIAPAIGARTLPVGRLLAVSTRVHPGVEVHEELVGGGADGPAVRVLRYEPSGRVRPSGALVWFHGGGYVMGVPQQSHDWCSAIAHRLGIAVVSVDYRLAPEHPFPAGLDDGASVLAWLRASADSLGIDVERLAVGGDSAGGGMAAALAQRDRGSGHAPLVHQLLVYPMLDDRTATDPDPCPKGALVWPARSNRFAWSVYLGAGRRGATPPTGAVPARVDDVAGLPAAWIGVGDIDLFHHEDVAYADRLRAAGIPCDLRIEPGMYHAADALCPRDAGMRAFRSAAIDSLAAALARP